MKKYVSVVFIILTYFGTLDAKAQITVTQAGAQSPQQLVQNILVGTGVTVSNVKFNGSPATLGYTNQIGSFTTGGTATNLGFSSGLFMSTGGISGSINNTITSTITGSDYTNVPELQQYNPNGTVVHDAAVLEFDFIPLSDTVRFRYAFASYEYNSFVCTQYNDIFGFFIKMAGSPLPYQNIALIPGTNLPVSINSVNDGTPNGTVTPCYTNYTQFYHVPTPNITYYGMTTVFTAVAQVIPCVPYHIKLEIADLGDEAYDSGVFLEANSFTSQSATITTSYSLPSAGNNGIEGCNDAIIKIKMPQIQPQGYIVPIAQIFGTATEGVDFPVLNPNIFITPGTDTGSIVITPFLDNIPEGTESISLVIQTSPCGYDTVTVFIQDYADMTANAWGDTTFCNDHKLMGVTPQGGLPPYSYLWSNGGNTQTITPTFTSSSQFTVNVTDKCLKSVQDSVQITLICDFADAGPDTTICEGGTAILHGSGGGTYLWSNGDINAVVTVSPATTTTYILQVTNVFNDWDTVTVFVTPNPTVIATINPAIICPKDSALLTVSGATTYQWSSNPVDASLLPNQNSASLYVKPLQNTRYVVTGANGACIAKDSVTISISPIPVPFILATPNPVSIFDPTVYFSDGSSGNTFWNWTISDGFTSGQQTFTHKFSDQDTGTYIVNLTVKNMAGCTGTTTATVIVQPDFTFFVPNSFTPNGDGLNDVFKAYGTGLLDFELIISNRWGEHVFSTKNIDEGWDGTVNSEPAPPDVYVYLINYTDNMGRTKVKAGAVSLIR